MNSRCKKMEIIVESYNKTIILSVIAADEGNNFQSERGDCIASTHGLTNCGSVRRDGQKRNPRSVLVERGDFISDGALVSCEASRGVAPRALQWRVMMAVGTRGNLRISTTLVILAKASVIN